MPGGPVSSRNGPFAHGDYAERYLAYLAPRAGFEPATNRLTAGCSTTELPGNTVRHAVMRTAYNKPVLFLQRTAAIQKKMEATPGIEPGYADLQSAASPLRHVALLEIGRWNSVAASSRRAPLYRRPSPGATV